MQGLNVLSLFDGISCGRLALDRVDIKINNYYASEIDRYAIQISHKNFPDTIQLGDVINVNSKDLPKIDLLIGGSPCQGFSKAGKQLNFDDPRSKLFFEYVRLLKELKPKYFLLENVKMKREYIKIISEYLGVNPIEINSNLISKQNRVRLYWTNIDVGEIKSIGNKFNDYLYRLGHGFMKRGIIFSEYYPTLVAQSPATKYRIIVDIDKARRASDIQLRRDPMISRSATPEECEEFQTLPIGYTSILPKTTRYKVIGNGWTVDIISHIFKNLNQTMKIGA